MTGSSYSIVQLLTFSGISIILFFACLIIGLFLFNIELSDKTKSYFTNSFLGFFTIISCYSVFNVGLKTINLVPIIVLIGLFFRSKNRVIWKDFEYKKLLPVLYIFPVIFILYGCYILPNSIENDVRFYAKIAYSLGNLKQENVYHFYNDYNSGFNGVMPYHYTEMWLSSFFSLLFHVKSIIALKYLAYPFLISCITYGVSGFFKNNKFLGFCLFIGLSYFPFYLISVLNTGYLIYTDFWLRPNFIIYYYSLIPLFYLIYERKWTLLFLFGALISSISVIIIPCLFGGLLAISLWIYKKREATLKEIIKYNTILFFSIIVMAAIFLFFSPKINLFAKYSFIEIVINSISMWKAILFFLFALVLQGSTLIFISFLINRYSIKDNNFNIIYLFVFFQVCIGVSLFQILNQLDNSYQFPYYAYSASGLILIISIVRLILSFKNPYFKWGSASFILVISIYLMSIGFDFKSLTISLEEKNLAENNISKNWVDKVDNYFRNNRNAKGGFVLSKKDLTDFNPKSRNCVTKQMGSFICYITDNCNLPSLTCSETLLSDKTERNKNDFEKAESWMKTFPKFINECNVTEYLNKKSIDYFICTKDKIIADSNFNVIEDSTTKYKLVYKR